MPEIVDLKNDADFEMMVQRSKEIPCFLFKHSTRCSISSSALRSYLKFVDSEPGAEYYRVLVVEERPLSNQVAEKTGIRHESPQVMLFRDGKVVWEESHWSIREKSLRGALESA